MKDEKCSHCGRGPSSQLMWQRKMISEGRCVRCSKMAVKGKGLCLNCMIKIREWQHKKKGSKTRHTGALTYRLEAQRKKCV